MTEPTHEPQRSPPAEPQAPTIELEIPLRRGVKLLIGTCLAAEIAFVLLDYHVNFGRLTDIGPLRRLTNIAREDSLASWFGTTQTLLIGFTLWLVYLAVRKQLLLRRQRTGWLVLAVFFTFMAIDDGAQLHERAGAVVSELASSDASSVAPSSWGSEAVSAFPSYAWQLVVLPLFAALGVYSLVFLWRVLDRRSSRLLVLVALACLALAVGLDFAEGLDEEHPWNLYTRITESFDFGDYTEYRYRASAYDTLEHFSRSIEEFLEMLANTIFWYVFLVALAERMGELRVRLIRKGSGLTRPQASQDLRR